MTENKREFIINLQIKKFQLEDNIRKVNPKKQITELSLSFIQFFVGIGTLIIFLYLIYENNRIPDTVIYLSGPILLVLVLWIYDSLRELKAGLIRYRRAKEAFNDGIYALEYATKLLSKFE